MINEICIKAVQKWGKDHQIDKCIEECAELMNELIKQRDNRSNIEDIADEIADVDIMLEQMKYIYGYDRCEAHKAKKLERLKEKICMKINTI